MSRRRLAVADAALAATIGEASPDQCREIAKGVAELAAAGMDEPRIRAGFAALQAGVFGESPVRTELEALVEELDDVAWRVQEESAGDDSGYLAAFSRARAASSLCFALGSDPRVAAAEATYEAHAALGDIEAVRAIADRVCHGSGPSGGQPRFEAAVFAVGHSLPSQVLRAFAEIEIPIGLLGAEYRAAPGLSVLAGPSGENLVRFGDLYDSAGSICFVPATGEVISLIEGSPATLLVNSSLSQFSDCVRAAIDLFPYYHRNGPLEEREAAGDRIARRIQEIDQPTLDVDGFWRTFLDDVVIGDYSVEDITFGLP